MRRHLARLVLIVVAQTFGLSACAVVKQYPEPGWRPARTREPVFEVTSAKEADSAPVRVRSVSACSWGFRVHIENDDDRAWAADLERSSLICFDGTKRRVDGRRAVVSVLEDRCVEIAFAPEDLAVLAEAPARLVGATCRLELLLVSAGHAQTRSVIVQARLVRVENRPALRM